MNKLLKLHMVKFMGRLLRLKDKKQLKPIVNSVKFLIMLPTKVLYSFCTR